MLYNIYLNKDSLYAYLVFFYTDRLIVQRSVLHIILSIFNILIIVIYTRPKLFILRLNIALLPTGYTELGPIYV